MSLFLFEFKQLSANSNSSLSLHKDTREPKLTLSNLRKYGKYEAFVTARTRLGYGRERSKEISFETLEDGKDFPYFNHILILYNSK